jgi:hypothetical protein
MRRPMHSRNSPRFLLCLVLSFLVASCDRTQQVSLTAEDFSFVPNLVQVTATLPITLSVYNAGRAPPIRPSPTAPAFSFRRGNRSGLPWRPRRARTSTYAGAKAMLI